jgi:YHS domain-containing protein
MNHNRIALALAMATAALLLGFTNAEGDPRARTQDNQASQEQSKPSPPVAMGQDAAKPEGKLVQADPKKICMVTNKAFDKDQIPVQIKGRTYYGCCEMCKGELEKDPKQRVAIDPVSRKKVDKSQAVIGVAPNGGIVYFESIGNLEKYNSTLASPRTN